ncbi:PREDICTED: centromere protein J [Dufourea novaeangliae]|uniref:centromere protein J n=1 Tax=Dufourea novaeangliae TaxID=178035 RepID=UPI0007676C18|nr:PREDICTED: centromere protein J [Dufourea novaeangliae]
MDLEATLVERLEKLRQWQLEQQERLLKQQQMQREMLTQKQDCIYKALELSIQELDLSENILHVNDLNKSETDNEYSMDLNESGRIKNYMEIVEQNVNNCNNFISQPQLPCKESIEQTKDKHDIRLTLLSPQQGKELEQFIIDGIAPLSYNETLTNHICIDDVPIPSPNKDFRTLLEEKLKDYENVSGEKTNSNSVTKVKKPFLRKGEGLSRFKLNRESQSSTRKTRSRSASFSTSTQPNSKHSKNEFRCDNVNRSTRNTQMTKSLHRTNEPQKHLGLKSVPLPKRKVRSKSESSTSVTQLEDYVQNVKNAESSTSDFDSRTQKEMEEVRVFELLEEKAENSSFCSTSSTVVAFLQQSTPFKMKKHQSPIIKNSKSRSAFKSNHAYVCTTPIKTNDSCCNYKSNGNQKEFLSVKNNKVSSNAKALDDIKENTKIDTNIKRHTASGNQLQSTQSQQNCYDIPNAENGNDVSLHVRFSEYNEYKTIGLTDTSSISSESLTLTNFCDEKVWNDTLTSEVFDTEMLSQSPTVIQDKMRNNDDKPKCEHSNGEEELSYKSLHGTITQKNGFNYNEDIHQQIYHNNESEFSDTTDQSRDDEQSILGEYDTNKSILQEINKLYNTEKSKKCVDKCNTKERNDLVDNYNDMARPNGQRSEENLQNTNKTIFKSELLKNRLLELEQEISIFRKENTALSIQRKKLEEDHRNLCKEYADKEKNLEDSRKQMEDRLQDERKKLAREKAALESRMRDSQEKAQQSKLERQEIQSLRQELETLREEFHIKESRWNAAQSRHKCQMRILRMENTKLKQEIERLQNLKKSNVRSKGKSGNFSNTRAIHQINKQINMQHEESKKSNDNSSSEETDQKLVEHITKATGKIDSQDAEEDKYNCKNNKSILNERLQKNQTSMVNVAKKRSLYENLIKEATVDLMEVQEQLYTSENLNESKSDSNGELRKLSRSINTIKNDSEELIKDSDAVVFTHTNSNENAQLHVQNEYEQSISSPKMSHKQHNQKLTSVSPDELLSNTCIKNTSPCQSNSNVDKQDIRQIQHPDGRIEYWYPNGNVKKIFPEEGLTKLIYYNGDVRETNKDGKIRYFYASTRTWHTTMPDGLEILEFADGQVERRLHDGAVEVSFPDGSVRILESDGSEKWTLPDGTLIQTFTNGEKVLSLPNGQREIHTKTHKRREYPDGTVKLIYPDGTQETRYSNGRIRLKDKDGNLLMDSYQ